MTAEEDMYDELLGAYALDALGDDERRLVDNYLRVNPQARKEVDELRNVATMMAWTSMEPPDGLWDRIAGSIGATAPAPTPTGELARVLPMAGKRSRFNALAASAIAVAAALVIVLAVSVFRTNDSSYSISDAMQQARKSADSRITTLHSPDGTVAVDAVVDRDGHGYLAATTLPGLPSGRTYQLWGLIDGEPISLGVLGHRPGVETFSVDGNLTALIISNEVAGGVATNANTAGLISADLA